MDHSPSPSPSRPANVYPQHPSPSLVHPIPVHLPLRPLSIPQGQEPTFHEEAEPPRRTIEERLGSTLAVAKSEQEKYAQRAKLAGMAVNAAMFAQIVVNALVTGLAAATNNRHAQIGVSAMGAIGTILAAFLVRIRGTREPERSVTHAQNLEKFIRQLEAFILDEGYSNDRKWDNDVKAFRQEFDNLQTAAHQSENGQPMVADQPSSLGGLKASV